MSPDLGSKQLEQLQIQQIQGALPPDLGGSSGPEKGELQHFGPNDGLTRTFFLRHFISKVMVVKDYWSKALTSPIEKSGIQLEVQRIFKKKRQNFVTYRTVFQSFHNVQLCFSYLLLICSPNLCTKNCTYISSLKNTILQFLDISSFCSGSLNVYGFDFLVLYVTLCIRRLYSLPV